MDIRQATAGYPAPSAWAVTETPTRLALARIAVVTAAAVTVAALAGCSVAPVVRWDNGVTRPAGGDGGAAQAYLHAARSGYRHAVADQLARERWLSNGLLGAGLLITGLAAGGVHRDAILGVSALGGASYLFGTQNLPRTRLGVYQAGVDALNCADRAFVPYATGAGELAGLQATLERLRQAQGGLDAALAEARVARAALDPGPDAVLLDAAVVLGETVTTKADAAATDARRFAAAAARASQELVVAVDRIDAAVVRALIESTPDPSAVLKSLGGIGGVIGAFAPQAGLESFLSNALARYDQTAKAFGDAEAKSGSAGGKVVPSQAEELASKVRQAAKVVVERSAAVLKATSGRLTAWNGDELKACGIVPPVAPLAVSADTVALAAGANQRRFVDIAGGVRPYFVEIDGAWLDGVEIRPPRRGDNRIEIVADGAKVKPGGQTSLRVSDSAAEPHALSVAVTVAAKLLTSAAPNVSAVAPAVAASAASGGTGDAAITPWKALQDIRIDGAVIGQVDGAPVFDSDKKRWRVKVSCSSPNASFALPVLRSALSAAALSAQPVAAADIDASTSPPGCLKDG